MHRALLIATIAATAALTEAPPMAHPLTDADVFPPDVSVPDDGDDRNAASVEPAFQALANRTRYLLERLADLKDQAIDWTAHHRFRGGFQSLLNLGLTGGTNEIVYTDEPGALAPRVRTTYIAPDACGWNNADWQTTFLEGGYSTGQVGAAVAGAILRVPLRLPSGAVLQRVEAVTQATNDPIRMQVARYRVSGNGSGVREALVEAQATGSNGLLSCVLNTPIDSDSFVAVRIIAGSTVLPFAGGYGIVGWIRAVWLDPGPRNF